MCGIVGAVSQRNVTKILLECLRRLEYRGYDSAGIAIFDKNQKIQRIRAAGKINILASELAANPLIGCIGIAHTRWATHGKPTENNAHPHISNNEIALVHNGIIENYQELRAKLQTAGYQFTSETDSEVIVHSIHYYSNQGNDFLTAVHKTTKDLTGAYALAIMHRDEANRIIVVRSGSPVVIGLGIEENFVASDALALIPVTNQFIYLEEGDIASIDTNQVTIYDSNLTPIQRQTHISEIAADSVERGNYRHFMQKEIFEQPQAISDTIEDRLTQSKILPESFGNNAEKIFSKIKRIQIAACGSSYHVGMAGRYWLEQIANIPCKVEIASELRYRQAVVEPDTLLITISQSGETADTLAVLRQAVSLPYAASLAICNVPESSLVRESDLVFMTRAGAEIGVATTKAFTAQLTALLMLAVTVGQLGNLKAEVAQDIINQLNHLPVAIEQILNLDGQIRQLATRFVDKHCGFYLGRGISYPIAMEGALKMKEISYIHAEAYPAGELKHGPLALIDKETPIVVIAPNDELIDKLNSNLHEVHARGGEIVVFADENANIQSKPDWSVLRIPTVGNAIAPIVYTVPLQLLAYHVAVLRGTDVDRPRNLAKSVTVE